ncbi:MAG: LIC_10091 family protein [Gemmatimonadota bacterium]
MVRLRTATFTVALILPASGWAQAATARPPAAAQRSSFAATVAALSEPGGFFDTDNLISNEPSYLHVIGKLATLRVSGGAYVGVGPDQNYSYVAAIRPAVAYMLDIRRDNALQHLMYKAIFSRSRTRIEYLSRWLGRRIPAQPGRWEAATPAQLVAYMDTAGVDEAAARRERAETVAAAAAAGVELSASDRETISRFHAEFQRRGLDLTFTSLGRPGQRDYPTLRELLLETDDAGRQSGYLSSEEKWRFVRDLHASDRIIPVVGDLAGLHALRAIGADIRRRGLAISAIYTSNAELYVMRDGGFPAFAENVATLPRATTSVIIRSYFNRGARHPQARAGYLTTQTLHSIDDFLRRYREGTLTSYWSVVTADVRE